MSVSFSLLIPAASLDVARLPHRTSPGKRRSLQIGYELRELRLQPCRLHALMARNKVGDGVLCLQSTQRLGDRLVVDRGEEEGRLKLACLHIVNERLPIGRSRVSDAVAPDGIEMLGDAGGQTAEIIVQFAIAVGFEDEVFRFEMLFAR